MADTYGANIYNTNNQLCVTTTEQVLVYDSTVIPNTGVNYNTVVNFGKEYPVNTPPLIAMNGSAFAGIKSMNKNANGNFSSVSLYTEANAKISVLSPSGLGPTVSGNYGLVTYNANGTKTFDSRTRQFRIKDIVYSADVSNGNMVYTINHAYVADPWYVLNGAYGVCTYGLYDFTGLGYLIVANSNTTTVKFTFQLTSGYWDSWAVPMTGRISIMVLELTN